MDYYNTTHKTGDDLKVVTEKAIGLQKKIEAYFKLFPDKEFTPPQIMENLHITAPLTSVRRAISNLTTDGILIKTSNLKMGIYGQSNYTWKLAVNSKTGQVNMSL